MSSRKHPPDKTEFIAPMDTYPLQKTSQYFKSLKHYLKVLIQILKHFEISSRVLWLYRNVVVHKQAETKRDDWTGRKQYFTEPLYYTQVQQNKQVLIVTAETVLTHTLSLMPSPDFSEEFLSILIHAQSSPF